MWSENGPMSTARAANSLDMGTAKVFVKGWKRGRERVRSVWTP